MSLRARHRTRVIAGALAAMQLAGVLHLALVRHTTCAEHGELVDAQTQVPAAPQNKRDTAVIDALTGPAGEHEHCLVALLGRAVFVAKSAVAPVPPEKTPSVCVASVATAWASPLIVAPKQSPPRRLPYPSHFFS